MTLPFSTRRAGPYTAALGQTVFNYVFPVTAASQLAVYRLRAGVELQLTLDNHYSVTGVGDPSGTVVLNSGALEGDVYVILGATPVERTTQFPGWKSMPPGAVDAQLNALEAQIQELRRDLGRCLQPSPTQQASLAMPDPVAGTVLGWNTAADAIENVQPSGMMWRGEWEPIIAYAVRDVVRRLGTSYVCIGGHTSSFATQPGAGADWQSYWEVMAQAGADGDEGPPGPGTGDVLASNNLSELDNKGEARDNLELGELATRDNVGTDQIANDAVTYAKLQNVSASARVLGRSSSGAGNVEEIPFTAWAQGAAASNDEAAFKAYANLEPGTDVQAYSAALEVWAGKTPPSGAVVGTSDGQALTSKTIDASANAISNLTTAMFAANVVDNDATLSAASALRLATQAAIKSYVDNVAAGLKWKLAVACKTTGPITLSGEQTIDGVTTNASRVLVDSQADPAENGIYLSGAGAWTRAADADTGTELVAAAVLVLQGTAFNTTQWVNTNTAITLGSTGVTFVQMAGAGTYSASGGLTLAGNDFSIANGGVTYAKIQNVTSDRLLGRDSSGAGTVEEIGVGGGGIEFTGSGSLQRSALTGDVTASAGSGTTTIADEAVTFAKMQHVATDRLVGRDSSGTGDMETLTVGGGIEFTGAGGIRRSALTGDVTASAGGTATTIADEAVTFAKMQHIATNQLVGRDAAGDGDMTQIAVSGGIEFTGSNAIQVSAFTGDVTKSAGGTSLTIANNAVTLAKMAQVATARFLGRATASTGNVEALTGTAATALLDDFTPDDGENPGISGLVPASEAGDAAGFKFLRADGSWQVPAGGGGLGVGDYGDVIVSSGGSVITIDDDAVSNAKLAEMPTATMKANLTGGTANPTDATVAQILALLGAFSGVNMQTFTSSGTYEPTTGMKSCLVFATGGGGGGGGAVSTSGRTSAACGGGAGETRIGVFTAATIGEDQAVTVGAAGAPGSDSGGNGGTGGTTTFGALLSAVGGSASGTGAPNNSGTNIGSAAGLGGSGGSGGFGNGGGDGWIAHTSISGNGGCSFWAGGGAGVTSSATGGYPGRDGRGYGAGGAGALTRNAGAAEGGAGGSGCVLIIEFF